MIRPIVLCFIPFFLLGCSGSLKVERVKMPPPLECLNGLAVNSKIPHEVIAVFPTAPGAETIETKTAMVPLPALDELYVVGFSGAVFASRDLSVETNPDTSLKKVAVNVETKLPDQLSKLSDAIGTLGTAQKDIREQKAKEKAEQKDPMTAENDALKLQLLNLMLKANRDAAERGEPLPYNNVGQ